MKRQRAFRVKVTAAGWVRRGGNNGLCGKFRSFTRDSFSGSLGISVRKKYAICYNRNHRTLRLFETRQMLYILRDGLNVLLRDTRVPETRGRGMAGGKY